MFIRRGCERTTFMPWLKVCHICCQLLRFSLGVGWNPVSGMMKINVTLIRITPIAPTMMGRATFEPPIRAAAPMPNREAVRPTWVARRKSLLAGSSPISSVIQAWVAPLVKV